MMNNRPGFFVDIHVIQTVPPSCVNRDDTGTPKTAVYGGVTRARVSSQAWKRAVREMFKSILPKDSLGQRTKLIVPMVADEIARLAPDANAEKCALSALEYAGLNVKDAKKGTDALFFMSIAQARALAKLAVKNCQDKKAYKDALACAPSIDMALFGRMVASDPSLNYDACAQVAHSISTHAVRNEYDYFTAVDDCKPDDNAGAGHVGSLEFNSSTLYRYATVDVRELSALIGNDTPDAVRGFLEAFILSMPTGKQNSYANRTLPDAVYIAVRADQPVNLAGAFERPVSTNGKGYVDESVKLFVKYAKRVYDNFAGEPETAYGIGEGLQEIADSVRLPLALDALKERVKAYVEWDGGVE